MQQFEYLTFRAVSGKVGWVGGDHALKEGQVPNLYEFLNERGAEGWELVSVVVAEVGSPGVMGMLGDTDYVQQFFLKRVVAEPS